MPIFKGSKATYITEVASWHYYVEPSHIQALSKQVSELATHPPEVQQAPSLHESAPGENTFAQTSAQLSAPTNRRFKRMPGIIIEVTVTR